MCEAMRDGLLQVPEEARDKGRYSFLPDSDRAGFIRAGFIRRVFFNAHLFQS